MGGHGGRNKGRRNFGGMNKIRFKKHDRHGYRCYQGGAANVGHVQQLQPDVPGQLRDRWVSGLKEREREREK